MAQIILWLIVGFIVVEYILEKILEWLNLKTWNKPLPAEVAGLYDQEKYRQAQQYAATNFWFSIVSSTFSLFVSVGFLAAGGFALVNDWALQVSPLPVVQALLFFGVLLGASSVINLPFGIYKTFVIEQRFGFNKTTPGTFAADKLKGLVLGAVIGGGLLALLTWLFGVLGPWFWLAAWGVVTAFSVFFAMFYTTLLLPLFNKLTPLEAGPLRSAIERYAAQVKFPLTNVFVMDGSKRSAKANAFFSGLGSKKNIVLYDTLIKDLSTEEITAVLAHEVGHYQHKHVLKSMGISVVQMGLMFFLFNLLSESSVMAQALGAAENNFHLALVAFSLLYAPVSHVTGILFNLYSRKNEYEADSYARQTYSAGPLIDALKKLSVNHLSNLQPHPAYVFVNYSHPTLLQRIRNLTA